MWTLKRKSETPFIATNRIMKCLETIEEINVTLLHVGLLKLSYICE